MIAIGVHHISFAVRDLERASAFYEGLLGLERIPRPDLGIPGLWYRAGAAEVHLIETPAGLDLGRPPEKLSPLANHQAFRIESYAAARDLFRARGLELLETSPERGQLWIRDPDGNVIELIAAPRD